MVAAVPVSETGQAASPGVSAARRRPPSWTTAAAAG